MRYLLDTNVVSDLVRHPQGRISEHIREVGEAQICTSIIVAAELRYALVREGRQDWRRSWKRYLARWKYSPSRHRPIPPMP